MDAVVYTRVSRLTDGRSTKDQEKECRHWCEVNDHPVEKVFTDDGISASRYGKTRDAWQELKEYLRPGHILVAWSSSRTTRDLGEYVALRNLCANLNVPLAYSGRVLDLTHGDDRFVGGLDALIAERESETIKMNILRGKRQSAAAGTPSGRPPWGYERVAPKEWKPDPIEAPRVRTAIRKILDGESMGATYRWLKSTGYAPASMSAFRDAILTPTYAGLRVHQGVIVDGIRGTWEPLIEEEEHYRIVARVERGRVLRRFQEIPGPEPRHLLSGIAKCGKCGAGLRHKALKGRKPCYVCDKGHVARLAEALDRLVEDWVFHRMSIVDPEEFEDDDPVVAEVVKQIHDMEDELLGWIESAGRGEMTPTSFSQIEKSLLQRIAEKRRSIAPAPRKQPLPIEDLQKNWQRYTMRQRREKVRALLTITVPPLGRKTRAIRDDVIIEQI